MNNTLSKVLIFAAGAAVGSAVSWKLLKDKYEQIANEEIECMKEFYLTQVTKECSKEDIPETVEEFETVKPMNIREYAERLAAQNEGKVQYSKILEATGYSGEEKTEVVELKEPYVIEPEEFGDLEGYDEISLIYFNDEVLTDDNYDLVDDADAKVGADFATHFGEYEDDSVFIRNEARRTDYEILADSRNYYGDVVKNPHRQREA